MINKFGLSAQLTVIVTRNQCAPQVQQLYTVAIPENQQVNSQIAQVQATDCDREFNFGRIVYAAIGDDTAQVNNDTCN